MVETRKTKYPSSNLLERSHFPSKMDITHFLCLIFLFNFHSLIVQGSEFSSATETENKKLQTYIVHVEQPDVVVLGQSRCRELVQIFSAIEYSASSDTRLHGLFIQKMSSVVLQRDWQRRKCKPWEWKRGLSQHVLKGYYVHRQHTHPTSWGCIRNWEFGKNQTLEKVW